MADTNMQKELSNLLGKKTLDPLEQTVFETGPKGGFTPPESINLYKETPTQFAQQPIGIEGADIDWYALGESGFKIANETFGAVIDHLITSKGNAIAELKDVYQTKLNDKYVELNTKQANARAKGEAIDQPIMDGLIKEINTLKTEWDGKARKVVENNEGSLFQPAIDYWDPKLDIKSLGSKYQELALRVRSSDRDISAASTKLLFDAQFNNIGKQKKTYDVVQMKNGVIDWDPTLTATDLVKSGEAPINEKPGTFPPGSVVGSTPYFMELDSKTGNYISRKDGAGNDLITLNPATGLWYMNPVADTTEMTGDERLYSVTIAQNHFMPEFNSRSALMSKQGNLTPEVSARMKFLGTKGILTQQEAFEMGAYGMMIPDAAIAYELKKQGFNEEVTGRILLATDAVRSGVSIENMGTVLDIRPENVVEARKSLDSLSSRDGLKGGRLADALTLNNEVLRKVFKVILDMDDDQTDDLLVTIERDGIVDPGGNSMVNLLQSNPHLQKTALRLLAHIEAQRSQFSTNGVLDKAKLEPFVTQFITDSRQQAGLVPITDQRGNKVALQNQNLTFLNQTKAKSSDVLMINTINLTADYTPEVASEAALKNAKGTFASLDTELFTSLYKGMGIETNQSPANNTKVFRDLPPSEQLRLALACTPVILQKYGYVPDSTLSKDEDLLRKSQAAMKAWQDILPASQWESSYVISPKNQSYATNANGGIPIGFKTMMTQSGVNLMPLLVPPSATTYSDGWFTPTMQDGAPIFKLPASNDRTSTDNLDKALKFTIAKRESGAEIYNLTTKESAAASKPQAIEVAISQATFVNHTAVARVFANQNDVFLANMTTADISTALILNYDKLVNAAEASKETASVVPILLNDFGGGKESKPIIFSQETLELMRTQALAKGAKTMADFAAFTISVAVEKLRNREELDHWDRQAAENKKVATTAGQEESLGLYKPNSTFFVKRMDTLSKTGYNIYKSKKENVFYAFKDGVTIDPSLELYFDAVKPNEDTAAYTKRFNKTFGDILIQNKNAETIKSTVRNMVGGTTEMPIEAFFQKQTVLPSTKIKAFQTEMAAFLNRNDLMSSTDPATKLEIKTYDFAGLYLRTGELPAEWSDLPAKFALPGNSRHQVTDPNEMLPPPVSGLSNSIEDNIEENFDPFAQPTNNPQEAGYRERELKGYKQKGYRELKASLLSQAFAENNLDAVLSQTIGDPVSILRTRDEEVTNLPQDTANFLLSAFDKPTSSRVIQEILDGNEQFVYGVSKETYMGVIANFVAQKWEPAAFEYQLRNALKQDRLLKEKEGSSRFMTVGEAIASIDPSSFPLEPQVEKKWIDAGLKALEIYHNSQDISTLEELDWTQDQEYNLPRQDRFEKHQKKTKELEEQLRDPKQFADLRQEFLMQWLLPQSRTITQTPDDLWFKTFTKRLLAK
jgi:hypothetical protein